MLHTHKKGTSKIFLCRVLMVPLWFSATPLPSLMAFRAQGWVFSCFNNKNIISAHPAAQIASYLMICLIQTETIRTNIAVTEYVKEENHSTILPFRLFWENSDEGTCCTFWRRVVISLHHCQARELTHFIFQHKLYIKDEMKSRGRGSWDCLYEKRTGCCDRHVDFKLVQWTHQRM